MKFGRTVKIADSRASPVFQGSFLNHKGLKKFLKFRCMRLKQIPEDGLSYHQAVQATSKEFLLMLASQLKEVDRRFETEARSVIRTFDSQKPKRRSYVLHREPQASRMNPQVAQDLAERARGCQEYAQINAQALKKICKKLDKALNVKNGHQFYQACWRGDIAVKSFLSAPMLAELAAVEELCKSSCQDLGHLNGPFSDTDSVTANSLSDPDSLKCPICLDVMYMPLALECGHRLCSRCAIALALGQNGKVGDVDALLASGPVGRSEAPCPQCRATEHGNSEGVFYNAQRLPHLDDLIKSRYPEDWQRRKLEDEAEQKDLKAAAQAKAPHGLFSFFKHHGLHGASPSNSAQT